MYKFHNHMLPDLFENVFILNSSIHSYETRQSANYKLPLCTSNLRKNTIFFNGPKIWNALHESIRSIPTLNSLNIG